MSNYDKRIKFLEKKVEQIKSKLIKLEELRPGSLSKQYNVCGSPNCKCKADPPKKHGPYYNLSFTRNGRGHTKFIKKEDVSSVKIQIKNYKLLKSLFNEWIEYSTELSEIRLLGKYVHKK